MNEDYGFSTDDSYSKRPKNYKGGQGEAEYARVIDGTSTGVDRDANLHCPGGAQETSDY